MQVLSRIFSSKIQLIYNAFSLKHGSKTHYPCNENIFYPRTEYILLASRMFSTCEQNIFYLRVECFLPASRMVTTCVFREEAARFNVINVSAVQGGQLGDSQGCPC